jgi:hypothetical protein
MHSSDCRRHTIQHSVEIIGPNEVLSERDVWQTLITQP